MYVHTFKPFSWAALARACLLYTSYTGNGYGTDYYQTVYDCSIELELSLRKNNGEYVYDYFTTTPTVDSIKTNAYLESLGINLSLIEAGEDMEIYAAAH